MPHIFVANTTAKFHIITCCSLLCFSANANAPRWCQANCQDDGYYSASLNIGSNCISLAHSDSFGAYVVAQYFFPKGQVLEPRLIG